jgi:hypothetical protein
VPRRPRSTSSSLAFEPAVAAVRRTGLATHPGEDEDSAIESTVGPSGTKEPAMQTRLIDRAVAFCLAAAVTLAMLGGIDQLAQRDSAASLWAQQSSNQA